MFHIQVVSYTAEKRVGRVLGMGMGGVLSVRGFEVEGFGLSIRWVTKGFGRQKCCLFFALWARGFPVSSQNLKFCGRTRHRTHGVRISCETAHLTFFAGAAPPWTWKIPYLKENPRKPLLSDQKGAIYFGERKIWAKTAYSAQYSPEDHNIQWYY